MLEAERLAAAALALAAKVLDDQADQLHWSVRRLLSRTNQAQTSGGWKGPAAENYGRAAQARYDRMYFTRDRMHDLAAKFRGQAQQIRGSDTIAQRHLA